MQLLHTTLQFERIPNQVPHSPHTAFAAWQPRIVATVCVMNILRARDKQESATKSKSNAAFPFQPPPLPTISCFPRFSPAFSPWPLSRVSSFVACSLFATFILISCHDNDNDAGEAPHHAPSVVCRGVAALPTSFSPHSTFYQAACLSDQQQQQQQQQYISLATDFLWALFKPFVAASVATVSAGQGAKPCVAVCRCHVALSASVSLCVAPCGMRHGGSSSWRCDALSAPLTALPCRMPSNGKGPKAFCPGIQNATA